MDRDSVMSKSRSGSGSTKFVQKRRNRNLNGKKIADDEFMAAAIGDVEWLKQSLREARGKINYDKNGFSAFHLASIHGRIECLKMMLEKCDYDINLPSSTGWRAVHLAISNQTGKRSLQCLMYLLDKGADSSICNDDGITPVHQAASEGHVQCLKLLIEQGAKIDTKDCRDHTPLDLAKLWGHQKCARILAAETWHRDKDQVAREMKHLKKVKMQQVLQDLENEEEYKAAKEFYGEKGFQDWLKGKQGATDGKKDSKAVGRKKDWREDSKNSLAKPNSQKQERTKIPSAEPEMTPSVDARILSSQKAVSRPAIGTNQKTNKKDKKEDRTKQDTGHISHEPWKFSLQAPKPEYITNLKDDFPRDMYTMMPKAGPKIYTGKPMVADDLKKPESRKGSGHSEKAREKAENESTVKERPILFNCIHVHDIQTLKSYDEDFKGRTQAALHLYPDLGPDSIPFSLVVPRKTLTRATNTADQTDMTGFTKERFAETFNSSAFKQRSSFPNLESY